MTTVLHQLGEQQAAALAAAVPDAEIVAIPAQEPAPAGVRGEVLVATFPSGPDGLPVFDQLDELGVEFVQLLSTGVDAVPLSKLRGGGRVVASARGANAVPIAEFVLAGMLAFAKRMPDVWLHEPPARWNFTELLGLEGATVGIVGFGAIGQAVAERALPFGCRVVATRRHPDSGSPVPGVSVVGSLDEVLPIADHLVIAAPATAATRHLLDDVAFSKLKPGAHVVNIARGSLIDQDALRRALDSDVVAMATLDVCEPEPLPAGHWLYSHPRVRLSAHVSWVSPELFERTFDVVVANVRKWVAGEPIDGAVDFDEGY